MCWIVAVNREEAYVIHGYLSSANGATVAFCPNENDAHQFKTEAAAEAVAFLINGMVKEYTP
jgi:hypothetical protein